MVRAGMPASDVERHFDVSVRAVFKWVAVFCDVGQNALLAREGAGRPPKVSPDQLRWIADAVRGRTADHLKFELGVVDLAPNRQPDRTAVSHDAEPAEDVFLDSPEPVPFCHLGTTTMSMKASLLAFCVAGSSLAVSSEEVLKLSFNTSSVVSESEYPELFSRWPLRSAVNPSPHPPVIALSQGSGIELFRGKRWQVARRFPSGSLSIGYRSRTDAGFTELRLPGEWLARSYPMLILEGAAAELWLAVFDAGPPHSVVIAA